MRRSIRPSRGFSLVEAVIATSIVTLSSSVLLLGVESTFTTVDQSEEEMIADGLARQMLDEVQGKAWVDPDYRSDPYPTALTASAAELAATGRTLFDDSDDYNDYTMSPPIKLSGDVITTFTAGGTAMPTSFMVRSGFASEWKISTRVTYVSEADTSVETETPTNYRAIICDVAHQDADGSWRTVCQRKRIMCYVPTSS